MKRGAAILESREYWLVESGHASPAVATSGLRIPITVRGETIGTFNVADAEPIASGKKRN